MPRQKKEDSHDVQQVTTITGIEVGGKISQYLVSVNIFVPSCKHYKIQNCILKRIKCGIIRHD